MENVREYLKHDDSTFLKVAIFNKFGDTDYIGICGGLIAGAWDWYSHNVAEIEECVNEKYTGWVIKRMGNSGYYDGYENKIYIPNWVMNYEPKDYRHALNLFKKYIKVAA